MLDVIRFLVQSIIGARCEKLMESIGGAPTISAQAGKRGRDLHSVTLSRVCGVAAAIRARPWIRSFMQPHDSPEP
jgi:hypothetical protein